VSDDEDLLLPLIYPFQFCSFSSGTYGIRTKFGIQESVYRNTVTCVLDYNRTLIYISNKDLRFIPRSKKESLLYSIAFFQKGGVSSSGKAI